MTISSPVAYIGASGTMVISEVTSKIVNECSNYHIGEASVEKSL